LIFLTQSSTQKGEQAMNKNIFKLVFSKKLGALVVASELATNSVGQGQSNGKRRRNLVGLAKALPLTMLLGNL
jgi:hypothetical protein